MQNIIVEEKPTGEISLGAGVGTSGASTFFGVKENNFLGKGTKLDANIALTEESLKGQLFVINQNYNNTDRDLIFNLQASETDRLNDFGYKTNNTGVSIGTNFEDAYPALARAASAFYGTSLEKYAKKSTHFGTGTVDIGTLETVGVEEDASANQSSSQK